jgi:hypothetical protein
VCVVSECSCWRCTSGGLAAAPLRQARCRRALLSALQHVARAGRLLLACSDLAAALYWLPACGQRPWPHSCKRQGLTAGITSALQGLRSPTGPWEQSCCLAPLLLACPCCIHIAATPSHRCCPLQPGALLRRALPRRRCSALLPRAAAPAGRHRPQPGQGGHAEGAPRAGEGQPERRDAQGGRITAGDAWRPMGCATAPSCCPGCATAASCCPGCATAAATAACMPCMTGGGAGGGAASMRSSTLGWTVAGTAADAPAAQTHTING